MVSKSHKAKMLSHTKQDLATYPFSICANRKRGIKTIEKEDLDLGTSTVVQSPLHVLNGSMYQVNNCSSLLLLMNLGFRFSRFFSFQVQLQRKQQQQ
jgi:hypothetical protein